MDVAGEERLLLLVEHHLPVREARMAQAPGEHPGAPPRARGGVPGQPEMTEVDLHDLAGPGLAPHHRPHRLREVAVDVAAHGGLGVLDPQLHQQFVDHQQAVGLIEPPGDLLAVGIQRVCGAALSLLLFVVQLSELPLAGQLCRLQPAFLLGQLPHPADHAAVPAGLALDRLDRLVHPQSPHDLLQIHRRRPPRHLSPLTWFVGCSPRTVGREGGRFLCREGGRFERRPGVTFPWRTVD